MKEDRAALYIELWSAGKYAVRRGGSNRALVLKHTQAEALVHAKSLNPLGGTFLRCSSDVESSGSSPWQKLQ
jgi:hypothetical protein